MTDVDHAGWPETPGIDGWVPITAIPRLLADLGRPLGAEPCGGWIRSMYGEPATPPSATVEVFWIAAGRLNYAVLDEVRRQWIVVARRSVSLNGLAARVWSAVAPFVIESDRDGR